MAYTTINKSSDYFNTKLYTGTGSAQSITGVDFQPDLLWIKKRNGAVNHLLHDAIRGVTKLLVPNTTGAEDVNTNILTSFDSDGFTVGTNSASNNNGDTFASWNWKANGAGSANTDGATASTVSVNTTAGFSIVKYTGAGSTTYGHGLGTTPQMIIIKKLNSSDDWFVYHHSVITASASNKFFMRLNNTNALESNGSAYTFTSVSNTTFGVGNDDKISESGDSFIAYCFAEKTGYSKFGRFTANGSTDNAFIYTGFKPAFVMMKCDNVTDGWSKWYMFDSTRSPENMNVKELEANTTGVESNGGANYAQIDMLSNGFKIRNGSSWGPSTNGNTNIYMCFAEAPLVGSNNVPCTAR